MKKYKLNFLIFVCICIFPLSASAGVICNDGWESSCVVSGPGCCSHHGGVAGGGTYTGNEYGNSSSNSNYNSSNNESYDTWFVIFLISCFLIYYIVEKIHEVRYNHKIQEQKRIKLEQEKEEKRRKEREELLKRKKKIGTTYNTKEGYINSFISQLNNLNLNKKMIEDGYFKLVKLDEILFNNKLRDRYNAFKIIIDVCCENKFNLIKDKVLSFDKINKNEMKYYLKKFNDKDINIKHMIKINKIEYIDLMLNNSDKTIQCNDLLKIYNKSRYIYQKIISNKFTISYALNDIIDIININDLYNEYITNGNKFDCNDVYKIYIKIISLSDEKVSLFLNKHSNEIIKLNKKYNDILLLAYINKKKKTFKMLSDFGFNKNIFPLKEDQDKVINILSKDYNWVSLKIKREDYDFVYGVVDAIEANYSFKRFLDEYNKLKNKNVYYRGESLIIRAIKFNNYKAVEFLLDEKCDLFRIENKYSTNGFNPLIYSIYKKHYKITKLLIEKGVNINYPDIYGNTALDYACSFTNNLDLCDFIIKNGGVCSERDMMDKIKYAIDQNDKKLLPDINITKINELKKEK